MTLPQGRDQAFRIFSKKRKTPSLVFFYILYIDRGSYLLFPLLRSIIGTIMFHFRVRNETGWVHNVEPPLSMQTMDQ